MRWDGVISRAVYTAAHYTTATNMGIVNAFVPVFTIFISRLILKDVPNRLQSLAAYCHW